MASKEIHKATMDNHTNEGGLCLANQPLYAQPTNPTDLPSAFGAAEIAF
jgi:hypothetical protein